MLSVKWAVGCGRVWVAAASAEPLMSAETLRRVRKRQRRYLPLFERVAGMNALLLIAAVAVTIVVLAPHKISSFAINEEVVVLVAALALVVFVNLYLLRRVVR